VIDKSPKFFSLVLDFVRYKDLKLVFGNLTVKEKKILKSELEFFNLYSEPKRMIDSEILGETDLEGTVLEWTEGKNWELLFRASRDSFDASVFRQKCGGKGETLVLVKSTTGDIFGGYTSVGWSLNAPGGYTNDGNSWIFTLVNKHDVPPTKFTVSQAQYGICDNHNYGPTFGGGHDFHLSNNCNVNSESYSNFPHSYTNSTGKTNLLTTYNFQVENYEVFGNSKDF